MQYMIPNRRPATGMNTSTQSYSDSDANNGHNQFLCLWISPHADVALEALQRRKNLMLSRMSNMLHPRMHWQTMHFLVVIFF